LREQAAAFGIRGFKAPEPIRCPQPYRAHIGPCTCRHCGREFLRVRHGSPHYCSDRCVRGAHHVRVTAQSLTTSEARAAARANRICERCGTPLVSQRSTRRFCSIRCRVANHRAAPRASALPNSRPQGD
jgi:hypothetical protein